MANVTVNSGGSMYGPSGGTMPSPGFAGWGWAETGLDGAIVLRPSGPPASQFILTEASIVGTGLSISPNSSSSVALAIQDRTVTGIVSSFTFLSGTLANHGSISARYSVSGLALSFADLIAHSADLPVWLLSGNDTITGSGSFDTLNGYDGDDVFLPGYSGRYPSQTMFDQVVGGAGSDTVGYANLTLPVFVNLTTGIVTIASADAPNAARLTSIENATGSAGNDQLIGNSGINTLSGGLGNDILRGDAGADRLDGGAGIDRADYYTSLAGVMVNLTAGTGLGGDAQGDTLVDVENLFGSAHADVLTGSAVANSLYGHTGDDKLYGLAGNDYLLGQVGNDQLYGGLGNDSLVGDAGNDVLRGDEGADVLNGGDGADRADYNNSNAGVTINLFGGTASGGHAAGDTLIGIESLFGSSYADTLTGSAVANSLWGYNGNDRLLGLSGNDSLNGQNGDDALFGGEGIDVLGGGEGHDGLFGEAGNDSLYGGNGDDYLSGGEGNDVVWGEGGDDDIDAGAGNDFAVLGSGDDVFTLGLGDDRVRFDYGNGADTIRDFGNGRDVLDFTATDLTLAILQANTSETSAGVLISLGSGSILLEGLHLWQIEWNSDFIFG